MMGFSQVSLAVRGMPAEDVRNALSLEATKQKEAFPESAVTATTTPAGWYLVIAGIDDPVFREITEENLAGRLSQGSVEVITCFVEEHVMVSRAEGWKSGDLAWSVCHIGEEDLQNLEIEGTPPAEFKKIKAAAEKALEENGDDDVDSFFDIPVDVAAAITGYRYDQDIADHPDDKPFVVLVPKGSQPEQKKPWWKFW